MVKNLQAKCRRCRFDPLVGKIPSGGGNSNPSILAWEVPWTEEPGGLRVSHARAQSNTILQYMFLNVRTVAGSLFFCLVFLTTFNA